MKPVAEAPTLWIDSNEDSQHQWSKRCKELGVFSPRVQGLKVGDFKFMALGFMWTVERKSPNDLASSFIDGRLASQGLNLSSNEAEQGVLLIDGNPLVALYNVPPSALLNTLIEVQAIGIFIDFCHDGDVVRRLSELHGFLNKSDHSFFRRPKLPMPSQFRYANRNTYEKVRTLLTIKGLGEKAIVEILKHYTLDEVFSNPEIIRKVSPGTSRSTIRKMYEFLEKPLPEELKEPVKKGRKKDEVPDQETFEILRS
jgi:ERCC4-type nuclease